MFIFLANTHHDASIIEWSSSSWHTEARRMLFKFMHPLLRDSNVFCVIEQKWKELLVLLEEKLISRQLFIDKYIFHASNFHVLLRENT